MKKSLFLKLIVLCSLLGCIFLTAGATADGTVRDDRKMAKAGTAITITGSRYVAAGKEVQLSCTQAVKWKSSDAKTATVNSRGTVKGVKAGTVKITATAAGGAKATWKMTVTEKPASSVTLTCPEKTLDLSGTKAVTLTAKATPEKAAQSFAWSSSNEKVAKVSEEGKVTAVGKGKAKITAQATDGSKKKKTVTITVKDSGGSGLIKVGVIHRDPNESGYREKNVANLKQTFTKKKGYDATFIQADMPDDQLDAARKLIQKGVKYLLIHTYESSALEDVLQDARDAGIGVFFYDVLPDLDPELYTAAVLTNYENEGKTAVSWLEKQGLGTYDIIHLQGFLGSGAQIGRSGPLQAKVKADSKWTLVKEQDCEWNSEIAYQLVKDVINSGKKFNVIYAENDGMADGAVRALDEAGITHGVKGDVIIIGFDCNKWALKELLAGRWNYDGQCSPFQAGDIEKMIKTLEAGKAITGLNAQKVKYVTEKGFDARTITEKDVETYGLGE